MATEQAQPNIAEHFQALRWVQGRAGDIPRQIGLATDEKTAIEVLGVPIRAITLLAAMPPRDPATIRRNAAYVATLVTLVAPRWRGGHDWMAAQMRQRKAQASIIQNGWTITVAYDPRAGLLTWKAVR